MAYGLHSKKFGTRTNVCRQSNRDRPESFLRSLDLPSVPRYNLYVHGPRNQSPYFAITFQALAHE